VASTTGTGGALDRHRLRGTRTRQGPKRPAAATSNRAQPQGRKDVWSGTPHGGSSRRRKSHGIGTRRPDVHDRAPTVEVPFVWRFGSEVTSRDVKHFIVGLRSFVYPKMIVFIRDVRLRLRWL
jgi:hypothetical protein